MKNPVRQFWTWWTGELSDIVRGRGGMPALLLDLSKEEVRLVDRATGMRLAGATIGAPDWAEQLEVLRRTAERAVGKPPSVDLLLPDNQVLFSEEVFSSEAARDLRESAYWRIDRLSTHAAEDLCYDVSPPRPPDASGDVTAVVAVTPQKTTREAIDYAARWGFRPARVSCADGGGDFPQGPCFHRDDAPDPALRPLRLGVAALAAAVLLLAGVAVWRAYDARAQLAREASETVVESSRAADAVTAQAEAIRAFAAAATEPNSKRRSAREVWRIIAAAAEALPEAAYLDRLAYRDGTTRFEGRTKSTDGLLESVDAAPAFAAARFIETGSIAGGGASFVMEADLTPGGGR